jgi:hypothetical protein
MPAERNITPSVILFALGNCSSFASALWCGRSDLQGRRCPMRPALVMRRRKLLIALLVVAGALAIAVAVWLRGRAAPEPARLLPEADGFVYINLKPLRQFGVLGKGPVAREPEYEQFVRETGFQFERDLDEAAFAIHAAAPADKPRADRQPRYSEVFIGHFDIGRAVSYFHKISAGLERYREMDIFSIPLEGRTVRVALLGVDIVAVSNTDGPQVIHGIVDRYKQLAAPFGGPQLLRQHYRDIPFGTLAWAITRIAPDKRENGLFVLPGGFDLFFPPGTVVVGSVRYTTSAQLRLEAFAAGEEQARRIADQANAFLAIFRGLETSTQLGGADSDVKSFFASLKIEQDKNRAVLSASVPRGFLQKLFAEPLENPAGLGVEKPAQKPQPPAAKPKRRKK